MKFVDLFAGLGGFHLALSHEGHKCVFACEIKVELQNLYEKNFQMKASGDIRDIHPSEIPTHEILCAGFPCQPFSKAGKQIGLNDPKNGSLIKNVIEILSYHKPCYLLLENVPHLQRHNNGNTWNFIRNSLEKIGYNVKFAVLSPHEFGIPHLRKRLFIVGSLKEFFDFKFPKSTGEKGNITKHLTKQANSNLNLSKSHLLVLNLWEKILKAIPSQISLPTFPIWSMEWEATYPYENKSPLYLPVYKLSEYKGSLGQSLNSLSKTEQLKLLPNYAKRKDKKFPEWKIEFIRKNRQFYSENQKALRRFIPHLKKFPESWQKLEWNCENKNGRVIRNHLIQFRPSGIRIKGKNYIPSLVANCTHRPIIGWENRYLSLKEALTLQSIEPTFKLPKIENVAIKAIGNSVNVEVVRKIIKNLVKV